MDVNQIYVIVTFPLYIVLSVSIFKLMQQTAALQVI